MAEASITGKRLWLTLLASQRLAVVKCVCVLTNVTVNSAFLYQQFLSIWENKIKRRFVTSLRDLFHSLENILPVIVTWKEVG